MGAAIKAPFDCTATPTPARSVWLSVAKTSLGRAHATPPSAKMARSRQLKFLIMEQPTPASTPEVLQELTRNNVFHVVRVAEENEYDYRADFQENNFECFAFPYPDGTNPPDEVIKEWMDLVKMSARRNKKDQYPNGKAAIAIHCVAGLGRAPVLVALAYIEFGMSGLDAVTMLRSKRNGCINQRQLQFLEAYSKKVEDDKGCVMC